MILLLLIPVLVGALFLAGLTLVGFIAIPVLIIRHFKNNSTNYGTRN